LKKWELVENYLIKFLKNEVKKTGLQNVILGLSGGLDSAVVAVLCKKAFKNNIYTVMMPSQFSSDNSLEDAKALCKTFDIPTQTISIAPLLESYINNNMSNLRVGNFSARMRMSILFDKSAQYNALVIGTSNKSELLLGYGTIFGDLASAINPIGDIYKSELFEFAKYLKINEQIINKAPSADLWDGQSDEADLGYTYAQIDTVLKELIENRLNKSELINKGFDEHLVLMLMKRVFQNQFKRKMPIIAKLTNRTINQDFLYARDIGL
jgi:NAD+ synthase